MKTREAWFGVAMFLAIMTATVLTHRWLRPVEQAQASKVEPLLEFKKPVRTTIIRKTDAQTKLEVLPPLIPDKPKPREPAPDENNIARNEDAPRHVDDICTRHGGHKVTFYKRRHWQSWKCVYPRQR